MQRRKKKRQEQEAKIRAAEDARNKNSKRDLLIGGVAILAAFVWIQEEKTMILGFISFCAGVWYCIKSSSII